MNDIIAFLKVKGFTVADGAYPTYYHNDCHSIDISGDEISISDGTNWEQFISKDLHSIAGWYYLNYVDSATKFAIANGII